MTLADFRRTLERKAPPPGMNPALVALWHDGHGDWDSAHNVAQEIDGPIGAWVHAYLHRKEGDLGNAGYWYARASKPAANGSLDDEWEAIAATLLRDLTWAP
jgi:hypothetical protein